MPGGVLKEHVDHRPHPGGQRGALLSLDEVAKRAWKARTDPRVRAWTTRQLALAGNPQSKRGQMQAIVDAYRAKVPYVPDPVMVEFMASPVQTLCLDDHGLCILGADCDDAAITVIACGLSVGIAPIFAVGASYQGKPTMSHVYVGFEDERGVRVPVDPTTRLPVGTVHPAAREWWVDPMTGIDPTGAAGGGEFVGVGKPPSFAELSPAAAAGEWGELSIGGRRIGLGWAWPSEVLDFLQMWTPYVEGTVSALKLCAAATSDAGLAHQTSTNAKWLESLWHAYDSYDGYDFTNNAAAILTNLQQALYAAGLYTKQAKAQCPAVAWPDPAPLAHQSGVISALQDAGYVLVGQLELLGAGVGGVLVATGEVAKSVAKKAGGLVTFLSTPTPWVALAAVAGAVIAYEVWPRGHS